MACSESKRVEVENAVVRVDNPPNQTMLRAHTKPTKTSGSIPPIPGMLSINMNDD